MTAKKKAAKTPRAAATRKQSLQVAKKPTKRQRETVSGRFGNGEREAEKLARRIVAQVEDYMRAYAEGNSLSARVLSSLRESVKAELLAAVTVTETAAEVIGAGWVEVVQDVARVDEDGDMFLMKKCPNWRGRSFRHVRLIPATPPKAAAKKSGGT